MNNKTTGRWTTAESVQLLRIFFKDSGYPAEVITSQLNVFVRVLDFYAKRLPGPKTKNVQGVKLYEAAIRGIKIHVGQNASNFFNICIFLLEHAPKSWTSLSYLVPTRTAVQLRTHWQKTKIKLERIVKFIAESRQCSLWRAQKKCSSMDFAQKEQMAVSTLVYLANL